MNEQNFQHINQKFICVSYIGPESKIKKPFIKRLGEFQTEQEAQDFVAKNLPEPGYQNIILKQEIGKSQTDALAEWIAKH